MTSHKLYLLILAAFLLTSCFCPQHYYPSDNPPELPPCPPVSKPVRLALVLGGGGAKGLAHVGVLEELEAAHIPIDLIVGCSAGSIVGALYADDPSTENLKSTLLDLNPNILIDFDIWHARYGLCQGRSLRRFLRANLDAECFDELKIPFFIVATDLYSAELITIGGGPIIPAVEASSSIPLVFVPVALHGRVFVDGGVIDPVPVQVAKQFDPEVIVAVDLGSLLPQTLPTNLFGVASRSADIALLWQSEECVRDAHVVIRPELCGIGTFDDEFNEQIYQAGRVAAREALPKIITCLIEKGYMQNYSPEPLSKPGASPSFLPY
jgi:NTE family protein